MYSTKLVFAAVLASFFGTVFALVARRGVAFYNPNSHGGSILDSVGNGLGEPLNVIISGLSSPAVLTNDGIINYARAIGFSTECLGIHSGAPQSANLGDGNGLVKQTMEIRSLDKGNALTGTCTESIIGGNHFRVFRQNGALANSGALFLAVSKERTFIDKHTIEENGYNAGRDALVSAAVGTKNHGGVVYFTTSQDVAGLLKPGWGGVNHGIPQDGIMKLLTVTIVH